MAPPSEEGLQVAWRALADGANDRDAEGWRTIPVGRAGPCRILVGRRFRGGEEAVLIGFPRTTVVPDGGTLPRGRGFHVEVVRERIPGATRTWVALVRHHAGSMTMFTRMAEDTIDLLRDTADTDVPIRLFTGRIRAWQAFMEPGRDDVLGPSAEIGLVGELRFLQELLNFGVAPPVAVDGWRGPLDELHDFVLGAGAIEVKATTASGEFPANVGSLDQLDDSLVSPLFLAAVRLVLSSSGQTLPQIVAAVADRLAGDVAVRARFHDLVLHAGVLDAAQHRYVRQFAPAGTVIFRVGGEFPRLMRRNVARPVRSVRYELDLDAVRLPGVELGGVLRDLLVV